MDKRKLLQIIVIGFLAVVLAVGIITYFHWGKPTSSDAVAFQGSVIANNKGCAYDGSCVLIIQTADGRKINAYYGGGLTPSGACYRSEGFQFSPGDEVEISGILTDPDTVSLCDQTASMRKLSSPSASATIWKTYHNEKYGFTIRYPADQLDPTIVTNSTSAIYSSTVAGDEFGIDFDDASLPFQNPIYSAFGDRYDYLFYSTSTHEWIAGGDADPGTCPDEATTTNQGVPFYIITTGHHAGDSFDAYVTTKGIIAVSQGIYFANDRFLRDEITFDNPQSVLKVGCQVAII